MNEQLLNVVLAPTITTLVGAFAGWFFGRKKQRAEASLQELDAVEKAVSIWRQIAQDLKAELQEQKIKIDSLSQEVEELRKENAIAWAELRAAKLKCNE